MTINTEPYKESGDKDQSIINKIFSKFGDLVGMVCSIGFLLIFTLVGIGPIIEYFTSGGWITTEGYVKHYNIASDGEGNTRPEVEYIFYVDTQEYNGKTYAFGAYIYTNIRSSRKYKIGQKVMVHYSPSDPNMNVLNREIDVGALFFLALPVVVLGALLFKKTGDERASIDGV